MRRPGISLILSFYNQADWAEPIILSALSQATREPYEVIICDDGSTDELLKIVRELGAKRRDNIRYIWQPDEGFRLSRSRNNGIRCSQGDVLVFADGDMWLAPDFLDDHARAQQDRVLVCGLRWTVDPAEISAPLLRSGRFYKSLCSRQPDELEHRLQRRRHHSKQPWLACLGGNFSVRRSAEVFFDEAFEGWGSEDRDLACRLYQLGYRPKLLSSPNAIQIKTAASHWSNMDQEGVVAFLHNKLLLRRKFPGGEMSESLSLVEYCRYDAEGDQWVVVPERGGASVDAVLDEFGRWYAKRTPAKQQMESLTDSIARDSDLPGFSAASVVGDLGDRNASARGTRS
jgi:glycosyltransferase involved in cell wall biosynthesis